MGMACEAEGRAPTAPPRPPAGHVTGNCSATKESGKDHRERSNSEETALILTSMSRQATFGGSQASGHGSDDEDDHRQGGHSDLEGDDLSGDEHDMDMDHADRGRGGNSRAGRAQVDGQTGSTMDYQGGLSHHFRNESNRVKSLVTKHISIDELRAHFDRPIIDVAKDFGICITLMKKICRRNGIKRWPHRQIRSLSKSIASMEAAMLSAQGAERDKYRDQIISLKLKRDAVIADPNKENSMIRPKTPTKDSSTRPHSHVPAAPRLSPRAGNVHSAASAGTPGGPKHGDHGNTAHSKGGRWTSEEHAAFLEGIRLYGKDWRRVAQVVSTRSAVQTRTHAQKYLLKFAGRFPFETEGVAAGGVHCKEDESAAISPGSGDDESTSESIIKEEDLQLKKSMAMLLTSTSHCDAMSEDFNTSGQDASPSVVTLAISTEVPGGEVDGVMQNPRGPMPLRPPPLIIPSAMSTQRKDPATPSPLGS